METGSKYSIYNDGDFYYLEIHHVNESDNAFYNCTATNQQGIATASSEVEVIRKFKNLYLNLICIKSESCRIIARPRGKETKAPSFIEVLPGLIDAITEETVTIECSVDGQPNPSIAWFKDGKPLFPGPNVMMSYDGESATLKLSNLTLQDQARYTCVAANSAGEAKSSTKINVIDSSMQRSGEAPKFHAHLKDKDAKDGDKVTFTVEIVEGTEPITISWLHDNCEIQDSPAFKYSSDANLHTLTIADAFPEDSGVYVCLATNKYGKAETGCTLTVQGKINQMDLPVYVH